MTLRQARCAFTLALADLIHFAASKGYEVALDQGKVPAEGSVHMKGSLHEVGLAQDVLLYVNGNYMTNTIDYTILGEYWERYGQDHNLPLRWGGRFSKPDGNHVSLAWEGKA